MLFALLLLITNVVFAFDASLHDFPDFGVPPPHWDNSNQVRHNDYHNYYVNQQHQDSASFEKASDAESATEIDGSSNGDSSSASNKPLVMAAVSPSVLLLLLANTA